MINTSKHPTQLSIFVSWLNNKLQVTLLVTSIILLFGSVVGTLFNANQFVKYSYWVNHTYEVNKAFQNIYSNTNAITATLRGYLLTGNTSLLHNLNTHELELLQHYGEALLLTKDNALQQARLRQLKTLMDSRLNKLHSEQNTNIAAEYMNILYDEALSNRIFELVRLAESEENRLLLKRQHNAQQSRNKLYFTLSITALSGLILIIILFTSFKKQISQHKKNEILLKQYHAIVESSNDAIITKSLTGIIQSWNEGAERIFGYTPKEVLGRPMKMLIPLNRHNEETEILKRIAAGEKVEHFETEHLHKNGHLIPVSNTISPVLDNNGKVIGASIIARDISERKLIEDAIKKLAFYDALTNLANRRLLNDRLGQRIAISKRNNIYSALIFLDLDNFKPMNDTHGHEVGDILLIEAANRLTCCIRKMDTVARFGGDEFVVMLVELDTDKETATTQAAVVAEKIRATLSEAYLFTIALAGQSDKKVEHHCTASIGVILFNGSEGSQDDIIKWADVAMYEAKNAGGNQVQFYDKKG